MSEENFAEKMKAAKEAKKLAAEQAAKEAEEKIELKAGDEIGVGIDGAEEVIVLDAEQAKDLNEQIQEVTVEKTPVEEPKKILDEKIEEVVKNAPVEITSNEIVLTSSEFHNFGHAIFEKNKPTFLTEKVLNDLEKLPNFKALVDSGVIKIGL